jgi:hypothetical protein
MATLAVFKQEIKKSIHGGQVWHIHAIDIETRREYITYLDPNNKNWRNWLPLTDNPQKGVIFEVDGDIRTKKNHPVIIDADIRPTFTVTSPRELADMLKAFWGVTDRNTFSHPLFE